MIDILETLLEGTDWYVIDECALECPCGYAIELDGECDECGETPLRINGYI